jgi:hypothetical protein
VDGSLVNPRAAGWTARLRRYYRHHHELTMSRGIQSGCPDLFRALRLSISDERLGRFVGVISIH